MLTVGIKFPTNGDFSNNDIIENELKYIFSYLTKTQPNRKPKPIHFYGVPFIGYPPLIDDLIFQFIQIRNRQDQTIPQQVWHFILSFPLLFSSAYDPCFFFADAIAELFGSAYPVTYAYHTENRHTGNRHSHFHYIISTSSYIPDYPALDSRRLEEFLIQMKNIACTYGIELYFQQSQEELKCLNLTKIF